MGCEALPSGPREIRASHIAVRYLREKYTMKKKTTPAFDPKVFLATVGTGRIQADYQKDQTIFSQGDPADSIFYVQKGKIKLTVVSF